MKKKKIIIIALVLLLLSAFSTIVIATREEGLGREFFKIFNRTQNNDVKIIAEYGDIKIYDTAFDNYELFYGDKKTDDEIIEHLIKNALLKKEMDKCGIAATDEEIDKEIEEQKKMMLLVLEEPEEDVAILLQDIMDNMNLTLEEYVNLDQYRDSIEFAVNIDKYYNYLLEHDTTGEISKIQSAEYLDKIKNELYDEIKNDIVYYDTRNN